jgi:ubiquitin carboxyl-terminal hydrolase 8
MSKQMCERFKKYRGMGLTGLDNIGNTCFINSTLQCLSHTYELNDLLDEIDICGSDKYDRQKAEILILRGWDELRRLMWDGNCTIEPHGFLRAVHNVARVKDKMIFTGYMQNDLPEFLLFLIDCFHTSIEKEVDMKILGKPITEEDKMAMKCYNMIKTMFSKSHSKIIDLFYGYHISKIKSVSSDYENSTFEPFFTLDLPINNCKTLEDCFDLYTSCEKMDEDNMIYNEGTKKKEMIEKNLMFWSLPEIFIIILKRFNNNNKKNNKLIKFPLENLDLSKYVIGYDKEDYVYDLYGICNHSGNALGGHYTSFVKNANGCWHLYNDSSVIEFKNIKDMVSSRAYCLFYRKKK